MGHYPRRHPAIQAEPTSARSGPGRLAMTCSARASALTSATSGVAWRASMPVNRKRAGSCLAAQPPGRVAPCRQRGIHEHLDDPARSNTSRAERSPGAEARLYFAHDANAAGSSSSSCNGDGTGNHVVPSGTAASRCGISSRVGAAGTACQPFFRQAPGRRGRHPASRRIPPPVQAGADPNRAHRPVAVPPACRRAASPSAGSPRGNRPGWQSW